jgi:hypothetical protein
MKAATMPASCVRGLVAACLLAGSLSAHGADAIADAGAIAEDVTLKTAWMRPAAAGTAEAQAYVDIVNAGAKDLDLVGATTPYAKKAELVQLAAGGDLSQAKVVKSMPVPAGKTTRLAYRGSHLRLIDITQDIGNGTAVPLTLTFKTPEGKEVIARVNAQGRGLLLPRQMPAATGDAAPAAAN